MNRFIAWVLAIVTSIVFVFIVLEIIVRLASSPPATETDATLGWVYKENFHLARTAAGGAVSWDFVTNSDRLRAPEGHGTGAKKPGETRVLLLGDSFTMGWALEADQTFASRLETMCAEKGQNVTVIPAGTEAYYTDQECLWLERNLQKYQPDALVVLPYANDVVGNALDKYLSNKKPLFHVDAKGEIAGDADSTPDNRNLLLKISRLVTLANNTRNAMTAAVEVPAASGGGKLQLDDFSFLRNEPPALVEGWKTTAAIAKRIVTKAKASGVKYVFAAPIPNKFEVHPGDATFFENNARCAPGSFDFARVTAKLGEAFAAAGATPIDARPALLAAGASKRVYYDHPQEWHFNADGANVFAAELYANLTKAGALPAPGAPVATPVGLALAAKHNAPGGIPNWAYVVGGLLAALSISYKLAYPEENPVFVVLKIAGLLTFVVGCFIAINYLTGMLPGMGKVFIFGLIILGIAIYGLYKTAPRLGTIGELFAALVNRGHWYLVPMLVVMLTISILLVVAQNPIVAPFIYTLF